jgi:hypothetical protein
MQPVPKACKAAIQTQNKTFFCGNSSIGESKFHILS